MNCIYPFTQNRGVFRPELPIAISNPKNGKAVITNALIDTGADVTVFPIAVLQLLGIDYIKDASSTSYVYGVSGKADRVWIHNIDIIVLKENNQDTFKAVRQVSVNCIDSQDSMLLLGTNFFSPEFKITLDYTNKMIMLEC